MKIEIYTRDLHKRTMFGYVEGMMTASMQETPDEIDEIWFTACDARSGEEAIVRFTFLEWQEVLKKVPRMFAEFDAKKTEGTR